MEPKELEKLTKLGEELQTGVKALQDAQEKLKTDTDTLIKGQIDRVANDIGEKLEAIQEKQGKLEAALNRPANDNQADDEAAKAQKAAFSSLLRKGDIRRLSDIEVKALSTDQADNGGYVVPIQTLGMISGRIFETSPLRRVANVITTSHKSVEVVLDDQEAAFAWAGEGDTVSESNTPGLGRLEIVTKKAVAYPKMTEEMAADASIDIERWLGEKVADKIARGENTAFVSGNGVSAPRGFLTKTAGTSTYARGSLEQIANGSTSAVTENGLIALLGSLKEGYQPRAVLAMKRAVFVEYMKLAGSSMFRFLNLQPQSGPSGTVLPGTPTLLEKPVILMDDMPTIAANALSVAYGDFSVGYTIVDRVGLSVRVDPYTAPGFIKYYFTKRTGGDVTNFEAIKLLKMSVS